MFVDRHQLDVREMRVLEVRDELVGQLAIVQEAVAFLDLPLPRAEVDLVNGDRAVEPLSVRPRSAIQSSSCHSKSVTSQTTDAVFGPHLGGETVRVGLLDEIAVVAALDLELVDFALDQVRDERFPRSPTSRSSASDGAGRPSG